MRQDNSTNMSTGMDSVNWNILRQPGPHVTLEFTSMDVSLWLEPITEPCSTRKLFSCLWAWIWFQVRILSRGDDRTCGWML